MVPEVEFKLVIVLALLIHAIFSTIYVLDLFKISKRKNKSIWVAVIIVFPIIGLFIYRATMKRPN